LIALQTTGEHLLANKVHMMKCVNAGSVNHFDQVCTSIIIEPPDHHHKNKLGVQVVLPLTSARQSPVKRYNHNYPNIIK
jgi:hypothetical protein